MLLDYLHYQSETRINPPTRAPVLLGVVFSLYFLALSFVSARLFVNWKLGRLGREDALIAASSALTLALLTTTAVMSRFGFGMHTSDIPLEWQPRYSKYVYSVCVLGGIPFGLNKVSMLCFYLRLAPHPNFRILCYFFMTFLILLHSIFVLINLAGCYPIAGGWNHDRSFHAKCITGTTFYYAMSFSGTTTDILLLALPIPILLQLQVPKMVKLGLVVMFTMGFLVTGVSFYFLYTVHRALNSMDNAWDGGYCWVIGIVECNVAIMTASMPGVYVFIRWMRGELVGVVAFAKSSPESDGGTIGRAQIRRYESDPTGMELTSVGSHNGSEELTSVGSYNGSEEHVLRGLDLTAGTADIRVEEGVRR